MRKIRKNVIVTILILTLGASTALLAYLHFFAADDRRLSGEWTGELHMTEQAAVTALGWLQDMEAVKVTLEDVESCMQELTVQIDLTLEQTARGEGTFQCNVLPESYDACRQAAYEGFAEAFRGLLAERLRMAGYAEGTDGETVEALVIETFGMSTVSYLMTCGPDLLPSLEELQAGYDGSGVYEAAEGILTRQFETGGAGAVRSERYIRKDASLILLEETGSGDSKKALDRYPVVYTLKQPQVR